MVVGFNTAQWWFPLLIKYPCLIATAAKPKSHNKKMIKSVILLY